MDLNTLAYDLPYQERQKQLLQALQKEYRFQFTHCDLYKKICQSQGYDKNTQFNTLSELPFLPVQYFKEAGKQLKIDTLKTSRELHSSATSGKPSTIAIDKETSKRQVKAVSTVLSTFIGATRRPFLICDVEPSTTILSNPSLSARFAATQGFLLFATTKTYLLEATTSSYTLNIERLKEHASTPLTLCGFTFLIYSQILKPLQEKGVHIPLPKGSSLIHIGGWKKLEDQKVDRHTFLKTVSDVFGLSPKHSIDIYGFTEQLGTLFCECEAGHKHCPPFAEVLVRDPFSLHCLPDGQTGIGQCLSLVPHSYPGFSLLTDDLFQITGRNTCPCGRPGTTFKILGRAPKTEIRGCGDVLAEKIMTLSKPRKATNESKHSYLVHPSPEHKWITSTLNLAHIQKQLTQAQQALIQLPVDDILGILHQASKNWQDNAAFSPYLPQGIGYIIGWLQSGQLQAMLDISLRGSRQVLNCFSSLGDPIKKYRAFPKGLVVHWLAGNVPTLGFISLLLSLVSKNTNIIKLPTTASPFLAQLIDDLSCTKYTRASGKTISGKILSDCIALVKIPRKNANQTQLSQLADARIAWGGSDAVRDIMALPKQYHATDIVFGPKLSLACIGKEALSSESKAKRLARKLAVDLSVFDQEACASAHQVFIEKGGAVSPLHFSQLLAEKMEETLQTIPPQSQNQGTLGRVKSARMQHYLNGKVIIPNSLSWSVLYQDQLNWPDPIYGRTALVRGIDHLESITKFLSRDNQVIGLALPHYRRHHIAELFTQAGVDRITEIGHMADFISPWDGLFPVDSLVRWSVMT